MVAAGLIALLVVPGAGPVGRAAAALATGTTAGFLQMLRLGWITLDHQGGFLPARRWIQKLGVDTLVVGLLWFTLRSPGIAALLAGVVLVALVTGAGPAYRAGRLSLMALFGFFRVAAGRSGWRKPRALPKWVRRGEGVRNLDHEDEGRGTPAAILRRNESRSFQDGWLVASGQGPRFVARSHRGGEGLALARRRLGAPVRRSVLTEVELRDPRGDMLLMVPVGGPGPEELARVLEECENL
jgi:hypothetical protein